MFDHLSLEVVGGGGGEWGIEMTSKLPANECPNRVLGLLIWIHSTEFCVFLKTRTLLCHPSTHIPHPLPLPPLPKFISF